MPTEEEIRNVVGPLLPRRGCPACGGRTWDISSSIYMSNVYSPEQRAVDVRRGIPTVGAMCKNCGMFLQYGAVKLGLVEPETETPAGPGYPGAYPPGPTMPYWG